MTHAHGSFCFAELHTSDPDRDARFYGDLFGWSTAPVPKSGGAYSMFQLEGKDVAGMRRGEGPRRWIPYLSVDSVDQVAAKAHQHGASLVAAPFDVPGIARLSVLHDPAGGIVGLWQAKGHDGAQLIDEPGSMWWVELLTRDVNVAKTFYSLLFGWKPIDTLKYGIRYAVFKDGDSSIAGILPIGTDWAIGPRWQVLFAVDDCDGKVKRAAALGGSTQFGPNDIPNAGRAAVVADPGGATFVLMQPNE